MVARCALAIFVVLCPLSGQEPEFSLAIVAGTLIDGTGDEPKHDVAVLVRGKTIAAIMPKEELGRHRVGRVIDASDGVVMPGLFDMHTHVTMTQRRFEPEDGRLRGHVAYRRQIAEWVVGEMVRHGVTTAREAGGFLKEAIALRDDIEAGRVKGPRLFVAGPLIEGGPSFHASMAVEVRTEEEARAEVRRQVSAGADVVKIYATLPRDLTTAVVDEAHRLGVRVLAHLGATTWADAIDLGVDDIIHSQHPTSGYNFFDDVGSEDSRELLSRTAARKVANTPSLVIARHFLADSAQLGSEQLSAMEELPPYIRAGWDQQHGFLLPGWLDRYGGRPGLSAELDDRYRFARDLTAAAHESGVLILPGTDCCNINTVPGLSLHQELELLVEAGLSPADVLRLATSAAAEWLGVSGDVGTLRAGMRADLIVLNADPLADIRNTREISAVVKAGSLVEPR